MVTRHQDKQALWSSCQQLRRIVMELVGMAFMLVASLGNYMQAPKKLMDYLV